MNLAPLIIIKTAPLEVIENPHLNLKYFSPEWVLPEVMLCHSFKGHRDYLSL
jgi:hypothetical protein